MTLDVDEAVPEQRARRAAVYRLFDAAGELLYIGSAYDPEERCKEHHSKAWWPQVASRTEEWRRSRLDAYAWEMKAIANEGPLHNVMGTPEYRDQCRLRARTDPRRQAIIRAGSDAGRGAPCAIVDAILRGDIKSYTKAGPVYFE
ncbi:GIY-YIG nuclease family protein [Streptomyces sp. NPDC002159]